MIVQQSQQFGHAKTKFRIAVALVDAVRRAGVPFFAMGEGPSVRIGKQKAFEPDAMVAALPEPAPDSLVVTNPIVVVEVLSPSTARLDTTVKLKGYFEVPSIQHYLVIDPEGRQIVHHRRTAAAVETKVAVEGEISLDPPGLTLALADVFDA